MGSPVRCCQKFIPAPKLRQVKGRGTPLVGVWWRSGLPTLVVRPLRLGHGTILEGLAPGCLDFLMMSLAKGGSSPLATQVASVGGRRGKLKYGLLGQEPGYEDPRRSSTCGQNEHPTQIAGGVCYPSG